MAGKYPKMLYSREYLTHCTVPDHDAERAQMKRSCTVVVQDPDDCAAKLAEGYRESYADFLNEPVEEAVEEAVSEIVAPPSKRNARRQSPDESPKIE